jgi:Tol biopolymer transport system component
MTVYARVAFAAVLALAAASPASTRSAPLVIVVRAGAASEAPYVVAYTGMPDARGRAALFAVRADGTGVTQLTSGEGLDYADAWSPDRSRLVLERVDDSGVFTTLWTVGLEGMPERALGASPYDEAPAWSPNGRWIAFQGQTDYGTGGGRASTTFDLWAEHPDGTELRLLGSGGTTGSSEEWIGFGLAWEWSSDSRRLAFMQPDPLRPENDDGDYGYRLIVREVATGRVDGRVPLPTDYSIPRPWMSWAWAPVGSRLAFVRPAVVSGKPPSNVSRGPFALAVLNPRTGKMRSLLAPLSTRRVRSEGGRPSLLENENGWAWSPDGKRLAIVASDDSRSGSHRARARLRLSTVDASTGSTWRVPGFVSTLQRENGSLALQGAGWSWSPDGRRLALIQSPRPGSFELLIADVSRHKTRIAGPATSATWSPDGKFVAVTVFKTTTNCGGVWIVKATTGERHRIISPNGADCDSSVRWEPDGRYLVFTRFSSQNETVFAVRPDGSHLQRLRRAQVTEVQWPDCSELFSYWNDWIAADTAGTLRLIKQSRFPEAAAANWRCP